MFQPYNTSVIIRNFKEFKLKILNAVIFNYKTFGLLCSRKCFMAINPEKASEIKF